MRRSTLGELSGEVWLRGGEASRLVTGERVSRDIDASFSHRITLPENLEVAYRDADGAERLLYFDRQYNDMLGLCTKTRKMTPYP